jgi:predicted ATP-binding protein involved in virulence
MNYYMKKVHEITITVEGKVGSGKSIILYIIEKILRLYGFAFRYEDVNEDISEKRMRDLDQELKETPRDEHVIVLKTLYKR